MADATSANKSQLTDKEMRLLALAWQCFRTTPEIDYEKLASISGYTPGSTRTNMGNIRRKLKTAAEMDLGPGTPGSTTKRKNGANNLEDDSSPTKRSKAKAVTGASPKKGKKALDNLKLEDAIVKLEGDNDKLDDDNDIFGKLKKEEEEEIDPFNGFYSQMN